MLYALFNEDKFVQFVKETPFTGTPKLKEFFDSNNQRIEYTRVVDRFDLESSSLEFATDLAERATKQFGTLFVPTYNSSMTKFGIVEVPKVGDEVSYAFNGDYYPCGVIERITDKLTVITSTGDRFRRVKNTAGWKKEGGTWWLVNGHVDRRSEEF